MIDLPGLMPGQILWSKRFWKNDKIGVMKKILAVLLTAILMRFLSVAPVLANEGTFLLTGNPGSGACFVTSVYVEGSYRVLASCRDLRSALTPEKNVYVIWVTGEKGAVRRLGAISYGKFNGSIDTRFDKMHVTVEYDSYANKPGDMVLAGNLSEINFGAGNLGRDVEMLTPTPIPTADTDAKVTGTATEPGESRGALTGVISVIFRIALVGFLILLVVVGVFSYMSRKRSL
jgi:hypothetical protein